MASEIKTNKISPATGTAFTLGDSGDTFTIPSGATIANSGTATGFGGDNTPAFSAYLSSDQTGISDATMTTVIFQTEYFDTDSAYDTSNGRFTVPSGEGGKYWVSFRIYIYAASGSGNAIATQGKLLKNGSTTSAVAEVGGQGGFPNGMPVQFSAIVTLSAGDYLQVQGYMNTSDSAAVGFGGDAYYRSYFGAYKMIGL
jgi:hypothetical protein